MGTGSYCKCIVCACFFLYTCTYNIFTITSSPLDWIRNFHNEVVCLIMFILQTLTFFSHQKDFGENVWISCHHIYKYISIIIRSFFFLLLCVSDRPTFYFIICLITVLIILVGGQSQNIYNYKSVKWIL